jgi:hypothetical protein
MFTGSLSQLNIHNKRLLVVNPQDVKPTSVVEAKLLQALPDSPPQGPIMTPFLDSWRLQQSRRRHSIGHIDASDSKDLKDVKGSTDLTSNRPSSPNPQTRRLANDSARSSSPPISNPHHRRRHYIRKTDGELVWQAPKVIATLDVHHTRSIKDELRKVGGVHLCYNLFAMAAHSPKSQAAAFYNAGLKILMSLLDKSRANFADFVKSNGFQIMYRLLSMNEVSKDIFEVWFFSLFCSCL